MAYRFKPREHPGKGLRRIYCEELDCACRQSRGGSHGPTARHVHEVRKHLKKTRAILRVICDEIGAKEFKRENRRLRDAGRKLSPLRDAEIRLKTLDRLREQFLGGRNEFPQIHRRLSLARRECAAEASAALKKVRKCLRTARRHGRDFKVSGLDADIFCDAVRRTFRRARAALRAADKGREHEAIHELRKRLKDLWYQLRIACPVRPKALEPQVGQAKELTELLGEYLDLAVLRTALEDGEPETSEERAAATALIDRRQPQLLEPAFELAEAFLAERPGAFAKRFRGYFG